MLDQQIDHLGPNSRIVVSQQNLCQGLPGLRIVAKSFKPSNASAVHPHWYRAARRKAKRSLTSADWVCSSTDRPIRRATQRPMDLSRRSTAAAGWIDLPHYRTGSVAASHRRQSEPGLDQRAQHSERATTPVLPKRPPSATSPAAKAAQLSPQRKPIASMATAPSGCTSPGAK